ncbi:spore coat U domain-containing protein [Citrobacter sedlakii]|uniref:Spore coat U domain-containing protein n=1 Tax=Citrobacter sedlakii TaxID=67826 RepID=A0ABS0ZV23_9ENTR|nr:spore coat U domain-containing protein [Citrobacter sedlakii]EKX8506225.1 spore coat U domain-containing protein [Citrobacter sedlakii]MBJ8381987.1 spore coat U domain-containing protein [Citrobacter sedlakii]HCA7078792.1 spore coat U domain-containing protein [Citrobacter sedlakii]HCA7135181.1 spore coat U domain-containing protein [Citrobacter sedlakii]HCA7181486.1 spore coat U domain-containing protein [Citrobacter sedlakii]
MSVSQRPLFALLLFILSAFNASASKCWITQGAGVTFGTLVTGSASTTHASVHFSCYADFGETRYFNVCLSSLEASPFKMTSNGDEEGKAYTMLFNLYSAVDNTRPLTAQTAGRALQTPLTVGGNQVGSGSFPLNAEIPAGQNNLPVRSYFNYALGLKLTWNSATRPEALTACQDGVSQGEAIDSASHASATLSDSCFIQNVSPLNFGVVNSTALRGQVNSTASIRARCPVGTRYSLGLSVGEHAHGQNRQMCNSQQQCLTYNLWQDAAMSRPWGDQIGNNTLEMDHHNGSIQDVTVYGSVPAQTLTGTGEFSDDVVVTLTY